MGLGMMAHRVQIKAMHAMGSAGTSHLTVEQTAIRVIGEVVLALAPRRGLMIEARRLVRAGA